MNWEAIGAMGEILGAIGVISSLFYVASQVKQNTLQSKLNTTAVKISSSEAINTASNDVRLRMAENPELASLFTKGQKDPNSLSEEESIRFRLYLASAVSNVQLIFESSELGVNELMTPTKNIMSRLLSEAGGKWFWKNYKTDYSEDFQSEIDKLLSKMSD